MSTPSIAPADNPQPVCPLLLLAAPGFDWPCACGRSSDACTARADGTCDG